MFFNFIRTAFEWIKSRFQRIVQNFNTTTTHPLPPLFEAIRTTNFTEVSKLLKNPTDRKSLWYGMNPLHYFLMYVPSTPPTVILSRSRTYTENHDSYIHRYNKIADLLMQIPEYRNALYEQQSTLWLALRYERYDLVRKLILKDADLEANVAGESLLHFAINIDAPIEIIELLIISGAKLESQCEGKTALHDAISSKKTAIAKLLVERGANLDALYKGKTAFVCALENKQFDVCKAIIEKGHPVSLPLSLVHAGFTYLDINFMFEHCTLAGVPLKSICQTRWNEFDHNHMPNRLALMKAGDPIAYLADHGFITPVNEAALRILEAKSNVERYDAEQKTALNTGNAEDDELVRLAVHHFENQIKPYFEKSFIGEEPFDLQTRIERFEKQIRVFIVDQLMAEINAAKTKTSDDLKLLDFLVNNKTKIAENNSPALKEVVGLLNPANPIHSALLIYNREAPTNGWPNLLTPQHSNEIIFSTKVAHQGQLTMSQGSLLAREWGVYSFLMLMDIINNPECVDRKAYVIDNYFLQLSCIRHTNGQNNPACYPGHISRFFLTMSNHPKITFPTSFKHDLPFYFLKLVIGKLKEFFAQMNTADERSHLVDALISLTDQNAVDVATKPSAYTENHLVQRNNFIDSLGSAESILVGMRENQAMHIVDRDVVYIDHYLVNVAQSPLAASIAGCLRDTEDRPPTQEELNSKNNYEKDSHEWHVYHALFKSMTSSMPQHTKSLSILETRHDYVVKKMPQLHAELSASALDQLLDTIVIDLSCEAEKCSDFKKVIKEDLNAVPAFAATLGSESSVHLENLFAQAMKTFSPRFDEARKKANLQTLGEKAEMFTQYSPLVISSFAESKLTAESLRRISELVVDEVHYAKGTPLDLAKLRKAIAEQKIPGVNVNGVEIEKLHQKLLEKIEIPRVTSASII